MMIYLRNALMAGKRLPYDAEVEYLQSSGTQWIDTGMTFDGSTKLEMDFKFTSFPNYANCHGQTWATGNYKPRFAFGKGSTSWGDWYCGIGDTNFRTGKTLDTMRHSFVVDAPQKTFAIDETSYTVNWSSFVLPTNPYSASLFCRTNVDNGTQDTYKISGQLYSCKIWQSSVLVRDYIPVRKGTVGYLYDRVSGKLFGNAGTGDFVLGPDVVPVEYIESHGTEWIDTGVSPFEGMGLRMQYKPMAQGVEQRLFGVRRATVFNYGYYGNTANFWDLSNRISMAQVPFDSVSVMTLDNGTIDFNNYQYSYTKVPTSADHCYLFAWNRNPLLFATARVYELKIWDSSAGNPLRSFRPVRVGTDATSWEGAMMDVLTRRIYRNAGTGAFTYGNDLKYPIPAE